MGGLLMAVFTGAFAVVCIVTFMEQPNLPAELARGRMLYLAWLGHTPEPIPALAGMGGYISAQIGHFFLGIPGWVSAHWRQLQDIWTAIGRLSD